MVQTIGNPLSWSVGHAQAAGRYIGDAVGHVGHGNLAADDLPRVQHIATSDLRGVLRQGIADFAASRSDVVFVVALYPLIGLLLAWMALDRNLLPLIFPIVSGFALVGPVAAVGLYEMSRQREAGHEPGWSDALAVMRSPRFGAILALGIMLGALFIVWILVAHAIYLATLGPVGPVTPGEFLRDVFTTDRGWAMIILGMAAGFVFAALVLVTSAIAFPLLLDRDIGMPGAVLTSIGVARANPGPMAAWGLIVAAGLLLGSLPFFLGLIVVLPVLGHATWHLYRRTVAAPDGGLARAPRP